MAYISEEDGTEAEEEPGKRVRGQHDDRSLSRKTYVTHAAKQPHSRVYVFGASVILAQGVQVNQVGSVDRRQKVQP